MRESDLRGVKDPKSSEIKGRRVKRPKMVGDGPLYVPQEIKDQNVGYFLYWAVSSDKNPYTLLELRRRGYDFVPAEQLKVLDESFGGANVGLEHTYSDGNYICTGTGSGTKSYLMRIKQELKDELDEMALEEILDNQSRIDADIDSVPGSYRKNMD